MAGGIIQSPERAADGLDWKLIAPVVVVDLGARLAAPVAALALAQAQGDVALVSSAVVTGLSALRAFLAGRVQASSVERLWRALVHATRGRSVLTLASRPDEQGTTALTQAIGNVAHARAGVVTRLIADSIALVVIVVVTVLTVGALWVALGGLVVGVGAAVVVTVQRRMRRAELLAYDHFIEAAHEFEVLAEAAPELRAHAAEEPHARGLADEVGKMAVEQRRAATFSSLTGLFPLGIALSLAALPMGLDVKALVDSVGGDIVEVGVLGATGLLFAFGLARSVEAWVRTAPYRRVLARYLSTQRAHRANGEVSVVWRDATVSMRDLGVVYEGADRATPGGVSAEWTPGVGLAVTGPNGAGKSTLALCMLGLLEPTEGELLVGGVPHDDVDWDAARRDISYLPQEPYIALDRSIAWHFDLLAGKPVAKEAMTRALRRVGLWDVLARRGNPLEVVASRLSGGERKRLQLARALVGEPQLVILDEPEASLDETARRWLRSLVAELAGSRRVLLIAHDPAVIPDAFQRLELHAGSEAEHSA